MGDAAIFSTEQLKLVLGAFVQPLPPPAPPSGLGNPGPLGLGGFALTTFCLSVFNTGVFMDKHAEGVVLPLALFYGGIAQFAAGMWEFQVNNTFGATAFTSYGAFWMSFAGYVWLIVPKLVAGGVDTSATTGLFLLAWLIFTSYMTVAALRVSAAVAAIFLTLWPAFLLLTIGAFAKNERCTHAGGWFGILCAFCAWYGSAAVTINSTWGRVVLPIGLFVQPKPALEAAKAVAKADAYEANI
jgi:succinate-acetate transporter protein